MIQYWSRPRTHYGLQSNQNATKIFVNILVQAEERERERETSLMVNGKSIGIRITR
jgi:hypothetical protein